MKQWHKSAATVLGGGLLILGGMNALAPQQPSENDGKTQQQVQEERARQQVQDGLNDLDDSRDVNQQRIDTEAADHAEAENKQKLTPGEHQPAEPGLPKLRLRIP